MRIALDVPDELANGQTIRPRSANVSNLPKSFARVFIGPIALCSLRHQIERRHRRRAGSRLSGPCAALHVLKPPVDSKHVVLPLLDGPLAERTTGPVAQVGHGPAPT